MADLKPRWRQVDGVWYLGDYEHWRELIGAWKFAGQRSAPERLVETMGAPPCLSTDCALLSAPQSRWRFASRGYNQAALLAEWLAAASGASIVDGLREPWRRQQTHLADSREARQTTRQISVDRRALAELADRPIWLIDDVLTTGRTLSTLRRAVEEAGLSVAGAVVLAHSKLRHQ